jgi:phosphoenolpyruvate carboxykinase (ATP)
MQYNTGGMGEIIVNDEATKKKKVIRKVERVPIPLMAAIQRGDLQFTNRQAVGRLGTKEVVGVEGFDMSNYDPKRYYTEEQIEAYVQDLVKGRRKFTEEIESEGLDREIVKWAEKSYEIARGAERASIRVEVPMNIATPELNRFAAPISSGGESLYRPPRSLGWTNR